MSETDGRRRDTDDPVPSPAQFRSGELARQWLRQQRGRSGAVPMLRWLGHPLRAAVLADLYLCGRIVETDDLSVDTAPTGDPATDRLLGYIEAHPNRTVDFVLRRGPSLTREMTSSLLQQGTWRRRALPRRFDDDHPDTLWFASPAEAARLDRTYPFGDAYAAALAILLFPSPAIPDEMFDRCSPADAFLRSYVSFIGFDRADNRTSAQWQGANAVW